MRAMLLAAGQGTRMAPLTPRRPKPTLPLLDQPLLLRLVRSLAEQGVESVVVNAHTNAELLSECLRSAPIPVELSHEPVLRGSGGGILQARSYLERSSPFLVLNADMAIELDLDELLRAHAQGGALATLLLRDDPRNQQFGTIGYAENGGVCRITDWIDRGSEVGCGLFTGVHVMEPTIFEHLPERQAFGIVRDVYGPWLRERVPIATCLQSPRAAWWPIGCPAELLDANLLALAQLLEARGAAPDAVLAAKDARLEGELRGPAWVGEGAHISPDACVGPWVVIGAGAQVQPGTRLERCLLLPDARPPSVATLERAIGFGEEVWVDA